MHKVVKGYTKQKATKYDVKNIKHGWAEKKFKNKEIISSIFSGHNTVRREINYKKKSAKNTNMWRLNNTLLNDQWITEEIKEEI